MSDELDNAPSAAKTWALKPQMSYAEWVAIVLAAEIARLTPVVEAAVAWRAGRDAYGEFAGDFYADDQLVQTVDAYTTPTTPEGLPPSQPEGGGK